MISCTEFIPLYSELFKYLEELGGHEEVVCHWETISDSTVSDSLGGEVTQKGIRGCWDYWSRRSTPFSGSLQRMRATASG